MSSSSPRAAATALVAAARRDLEHAEAALARTRERRPGDVDDLITLTLLARAARTADDATFALLDSRPRPPRPDLPRGSLAHIPQTGIAASREISRTDRAPRRRPG